MSNNLKDIADKLGLSISTISRVANGKSNVAPETRNKVQEVLKKYNYAPNQVARSLKIRSTNTVGIIIPDIEDYFASVIKGASALLSEEGYSLIVADTNESKEKEEQYIKVLYEKRVDGLILATVSDNHDLLSMYFDNSIPVVFFDNLPNLKIDYEVFLLDNAKASKMAVDHLISNGHKKIAIICGERNETTSKERERGFIEAMKANGLDIDMDLIKAGMYQNETGYQCMMELIKNRKEHYFSAVYVTSFKITCGAIRAIKDMGLRYPEDIALLGFDFTDENGLFSPKITSIVQPINDLGKLIATRLVNNMRKQYKTKYKPSKSGNPRRTLLEPGLKIGESCGCKSNN